MHYNSLILCTIIKKIVHFDLHVISNTIVHIGFRRKRTITNANLHEKCLIDRPQRSASIQTENRIIVTGQ